MNKFLPFLLLSLACGCTTVNHITAASQVVLYEKDPNAEKVVPTCLHLPALAYSRLASGSIFVWDLDKQAWK